MLNLLLALLLTAFPTPAQVRVDLAAADSLAAVHQQMLYGGLLVSDFLTNLTLSRIRGKVGRDFKVDTCSGGRIKIPAGNVAIPIEGEEDRVTAVSRVEFVETLLRRELRQSGWELVVWECDEAASLQVGVSGWIFEWRIRPAVECKSP